MKNIKEIQKIVKEIGEKLNSPKELLTVFNSPQPDGKPYISTEDYLYHYTSEERGIIFEEKITDDFDLLLYWIVSDIVFNMATQYELKNRIKNKDCRRLIFQHELQLFKHLRNDWHEKRRKEIESTLIDTPYNDD